MASGCQPAVVQSFDFSNITYPGEVKHPPAWEIGVKVTLGVIVDVVALVGNTLVIVIVVKFKSMRTTTNYYLVNLAVSDMLVAIMPIWVLVVNSLNEFWPFGGFLCKFCPFMQITAMCASMFTLIVIAGDRFFAIMFPMKSRVTRRKVSVVLILVWFAAVSIAAPLLYMYSFMSRQWKNLLETSCDELWPMKDTSGGKCDYGLASKKAYWIVVCFVLNWTPMLFMMIAYTIIVIKLSKHKIGPKLGASTKSTVQERSKRRVIIMLLSVLIVFIVCAAPFQVIKIYFLFTQGNEGYRLPDWYRTLDYGAVLLMYSNSAINPIIYGGLNESFRKGFKDLFNGAMNRNSPTASEEFETEFRNRSTMRARDSRNGTVNTYVTHVRRDSDTTIKATKRGPKDEDKGVLRVTKHVETTQSTIGTISEWAEYSLKL